MSQLLEIVKELITKTEEEQIRWSRGDEGFFAGGISLNRDRDRIIFSIQSGSKKESFSFSEKNTGEVGMYKVINMLYRLIEETVSSKYVSLNDIFNELEEE